MPANLSSAVASPCIKICRLDERQVCEGCGRSVAEIGEWLAASDARRLDIVEAAGRRLAQIKQSQDAQQ